jgi:hypothetical protein
MGCIFVQYIASSSSRQVPLAWSDLTLLAAPGESIVQIAHIEMVLQNFLIYN